MPFEAARALASKFCWEIRYALVPLFGPGFVNTCTRPEHQEANDFTIDQEVVRACQEEIKSWTQSGPVKSIRAPRTPLRRLPVPPTSAPRTPNASDKDVSPKDTRPRSSSPNGPDTSSSAETLRATRPTFTQPDWRAGNASTSPAVSLPASSPSPTPSSTAQSTTNTNDSSASKRTRSDVDWDEASSAASSEGRFGGKRRCIRKSPGKFGAAEVRAAYALMGLRES